MSVSEERKRGSRIALNGAGGELQLELRGLVGKRFGTHGLAAFQRSQHSAQDSSLYHQRRHATADQRRTHHQRAHFLATSLPCGARLIPSDSKPIRPENRGFAGS